MIYHINRKAESRQHLLCVFRPLSRLKERGSMAEAGKKAILVVSFGTSFSRTRAKTIDQIEKDIEEAFLDYRIYRAWTSKRIIEKLLRRDNVRIPTVKEAAEQMIADGITRVIVQPTHLVNGIENEEMKRDVLAFEADFEAVSFGDPLLTTTEDNEQALLAVMKEFSDMDPKDALVFMGHGTTHYANSVYAALDYMLKDLGYSHAFLGTVEAYPSLDTLLKRVGELRPGKVLLAPFMIVAGDHAIHDMSGEDEDSWRSRFEAEGFRVECLMKGLGEYEGIRRRFIEHVKAAESAI